MPERPRFAPVDALFPAVEPSVSQYKVPACARPPNSDTVSIARIATATVRIAFRHDPPTGFEMSLFRHRRTPGLVTNRLPCIRKNLIESTGSVTEFGRLFCIDVILPPQHLIDKLGHCRC